MRDRPARPGFSNVEDRCDDSSPSRSLPPLASSLAVTNPARADRCDDLAAQLAKQIDGMKVGKHRRRHRLSDASGGEAGLARLLGAQQAERDFCVIGEPQAAEGVLRLHRQRNRAGVHDPEGRMRCAARSAAPAASASCAARTSSRAIASSTSAAPARRRERASPCRASWIPRSDLAKLDQTLTLRRPGADAAAAASARPCLPACIARIGIERIGFRLSRSHCRFLAWFAASHFARRGFDFATTDLVSGFAEAAGFVSGSAATVDVVSGVAAVAGGSNCDGGPSGAGDRMTLFRSKSPSMLRGWSCANAVALATSDAATNATTLAIP